MHGVGVGGRMDRDRRDAHLLTGTRLMRSAISPRLAMRTLSNMLFDDHQRFAELDRLAVADEDFGDRPAGAGIWFIVFIASMMRSVCPSVTGSPILTKGAEPALRAGRPCRPSAI